MEDEPKKPEEKVVAVPLDRARRARGEGVVAMPRSKVASLRAFRRIRADRFFGAVGAILIAIGVVLVFTWPKPPEVKKEFSVDWPLTVQGAVTKTITLSPTAPARTEPFAAPGPNVTAVRWWFSWTDDVGNAAIEGDNFTISLKPLSTTNLTFETQQKFLLSGNQTLTFLMSGIPDIASVPALTEGEARQKVGPRVNVTGSGSYDFTFRVNNFNHDWDDSNSAAVAARDRGAPCQAPLCRQDTEFKLDFHFEYITYAVVYKKLF